MNQLTFYTNPQSRGMIVHWMLEEVGIDYETVSLEYGSDTEGGMKSPDYLAINPMGKVPAIRHETNQGEHIITECAAICCYLADTFPEAELAPPITERADYYRWLFFAAGPLEQGITNHTMQFEPSDPKQSMTLGYGHYDLVIDTLDQLLQSRDYITHNRFTAADVYVGSHIDFGLLFGTLPKRESFERYATHLRERAAYQRSHPML